MPGWDERTLIEGGEEPRPAMTRRAGSRRKNDDSEFGDGEDEGACRIGSIYMIKVYMMDLFLLLCIWLLLEGCRTGQ